MSSSTIVIIGHSHTASIQKALAKRNAHWAAPEWLNFRVVSLPHVMQTLGLTTRDVTHVQAGEAPRLHAAVVAEIERAIVPNSRVFIASMIGGNSHNVLGLIRSDTPFDFVLPESPDLPLEAGARIVPHGALKACLEGWLHYHRSTLDALRRQYPGRVLHLESPPPPSDDAFVAASLEDFSKGNTSTDVVSAALRYKLWRLHSTIVEHTCHELGIAFVQAPLEARDHAGFLAPQAYGNATHANAWYGSRVLFQLEAIAMIDQSERAA
jgi:hypothetical protein